MKSLLILTVQAKLRCLHDYHQRLLHNSVPLPSGSDIANTLKYFSQTLLSKYLHKTNCLSLSRENNCREAVRLPVECHFWENSLEWNFPA